MSDLAQSPRTRASVKRVKRDDVEGSDNDGTYHPSVGIVCITRLLIAGHRRSREMLAC